MAYQVSKTLEKFLWALGEVVIAGLASIYGNSPYYLVIVPIIEAARNWLKHRND
jgi:hypothetical protein